VPALKHRGAREGSQLKGQGQNRTGEIPPSGIAGGLAETWAMGRAKRAHTAETPTQPSLCLMLRALHFYPDHESHFLRGADAVTEAEGNTARRARASTCLTPRGLRPWHARTLFAREPGDLSFGQLLHWAGPCREGEEP